MLSYLVASIVGIVSAAIGLFVGLNWTKLQIMWHELAIRFLKWRISRLS